MASTSNFDLIENAKDSLEHAVDHLTKTPPLPPKDLKRGILDITHVIELLLKAALYNIHPAFIWEKVDEYPNEEKKTVSSDLALFRFRKFSYSGSIDFTEDTLRAIDSARKLRNQIEHFKFQIEDDHAHKIIGRLLSFIFDFSTRQLRLNWEEEFKKRPEWKSLLNDVDFWLRHAPLMEERVSSQGIKAIVCDECGKKTMKMNGICLLCGQVDQMVQCIKCQHSFPVSFVEYEDIDGFINAICKNCFGPTPEQIKQMIEEGKIKK